MITGFKIFMGFIFFVIAVFCVVAKRDGEFDNDYQKPEPMGENEGFVDVQPYRKECE